MFNHFSSHLLLHLSVDHLFSLMPLPPVALFTGKRPPDPSVGLSTSLDLPLISFQFSNHWTIPVICFQFSRPLILLLNLFSSQSLLDFLFICFPFNLPVSFCWSLYQPHFCVALISVQQPLDPAVDLFNNPIFVLIWFQFNNPLILLLLASAAVSIFMRQVDDAISITVVSFVPLPPFLKIFFLFNISTSRVGTCVSHENLRLFSPGGIGQYSNLICDLHKNH